MKKKIDRFVIQDVLSDGPNGTVYRADEELPGGIKRSVALKVLPALGNFDESARERFYNEVRLAVSLGGHPNVVTTYAVGMDDRVPWIAMELLPTTLAGEIGEQPAAPHNVARMMLDVAGGLQAIHALNPPLLHNDLSSSNILADKWSNYKISDFGLAAPASVDRTRVMTSVRFAAPELLSREFGPLSPSTDLYALGHIAYEMALGGKLYRAQFPAVYDQRGSGKDATPAKWLAWHCSTGTHASAVHDLLPGFPQWLGQLIATMMNKSADQRCPTAAAVLEQLKSPASAPTPAPAGASAYPVPLPPASPVAAKPADGSQGEIKYYVRLRGQVSGPFDMSSLQRQVRQGLISRLHQVSADRVAWRNAGTLEGLF